ncbi:MAG: maintenance system killer protein [Prevotella sp.]
MKKKPIHITEMRKQLDIAAIRAQAVNLRCWKLSTGDIIEYKGWLVKSGHWRGGTHKLINPENHQIREVRDICIFEYMGHEIYL